MKKFRAAFTLIEMLVTVSLSGVVGSIIYTVATETLASFARNISINKSYSDARASLDRMGEMIEASGHTPILVDATGQLITGTIVPGNPYAPGIRFYCYSTDPSYTIPSMPMLTASSLQVTFTANQAAPNAGNLVFIDSIGLQASINQVTVNSQPNGTNPGSATLTFAAPLSTYCSTNSNTPTTNWPVSSCLLFKQVAFIVVGNQLRYYPTAMSVSGNGAAAFNSPGNYKVIANLMANSPVVPTTVFSPIQPFCIGTGSTIKVSIWAQAPDYYNRSYNSTTNTYTNNSAYNSAGGADTFTAMQTSFASRCPLLLHGPY